MLSFHSLIGFEVVAGLNGNIDIHILAALSRSLCSVCLGSGGMQWCIEAVYCRGLAGTADANADEPAGGREREAGRRGSGTLTSPDVTPD